MMKEAWHRCKQLAEAGKLFEAVISFQFNMLFTQVHASKLTCDSTRRCYYYTVKTCSVFRHVVVHVQTYENNTRAIIVYTY